MGVFGRRGYRRASIDRLIAPVEDHLSGDFGMELDAINRFAGSESLLAAFIGVGQRVGPGGKGRFRCASEKTLRGGQTPNTGSSSAAACK